MGSGSAKVQSANLCFWEGEEEAGSEKNWSALLWEEKAQKMKPLGGEKVNLFAEKMAIFIHSRKYIRRISKDK